MDIMILLYMIFTDTQEVRNDGYDKYQIGIDREGNVLYGIYQRLIVKYMDSRR